ncbi:MAG: DEAD/DEAH box helicase [Bdellovibrionales bacterium]|nr:DEAD/DEAH box helicase [Bdellovibrionales bacterium]
MEEFPAEAPDSAATGDPGEETSADETTPSSPAPGSVIEEANYFQTDTHWRDLGLRPELLQLIETAGYNFPTMVQVKAIPLAIEGEDIIGSARTGSGKTAAFCFPMVHRLFGKKGTYGLVLAPTREIALQIQETLVLFAHPLGLTSVCLIGGTDLKADARALLEYPNIIVGTPGRICDHLEHGRLWLDFIQFLVLDEADRMLDMGFSDQLAQITGACPTDRQTMLFSATMGGPVRDLAERILHTPKSVIIGKPLEAAKSISQKLIWTTEDGKKRELLRLLGRHPEASVIIFVRSKDGASRLWQTLHSAGFHNATYISSNKAQVHREEALNGFKAGRYKILVATDVAARGIHVENVAFVVNYELPMETEDYIHRIGRTGRKDNTGTAITLATGRDRRDIAAIEKLLGQKLEAQNELPEGDFGRGGDRGGRGGGRGGRGGRGGGGRGGYSEPREETPQPRRVFSASGAAKVEFKAPTSDAPEGTPQPPREDRRPRGPQPPQRTGAVPRGPRPPAQPGQKLAPLTADSMFYGPDADAKDPFAGLEQPRSEGRGGGGRGRNGGRGEGRDAGSSEGGGARKRRRGGRGRRGGGRGPGGGGAPGGSGPSGGGA